MSLTIQTLVQGDTQYIAKHNGNYANIAAAIEALQTAVSGAATSSSGTNNTNYLLALFGTSAAVIGSNSYAQSTAATKMTLQPGYAWRPSLPAVVQLSAAQTLDFSGQSAGTYYITPDPSGNPVIATSPTDALYSVVWTGTAFGAITRLANIGWGEADWLAAQSSTALGATYLTLDARLEAGEAIAKAAQAAAAAAETYITGLLAKDVSGAVDVQLSATDAANHLLHFTGALTANISAIITIGAGTPRAWVAKNDATGGTLTLKPSAGTGVVLKAGQWVPVLYDGTNLVAMTPHDAEPVNLISFYAGQPIANQKLLQAITPQPTVFPQNLTGSYAYCDTAPTNAVTLNVNHLDTAGTATTVGTIAFAAGAKVGTFTMANAVTTAPGERMQVMTTTAAPDATFADLTLALGGTYTPS